MGQGSCLFLHKGQRSLPVGRWQVVGEEDCAWFGGPQVLILGLPLFMVSSWVRTRSPSAGHWFSQGLQRAWFLALRGLSGQEEVSTTLSARV